MCYNFENKVFIVGRNCWIILHNIYQGLHRNMIQSKIGKDLGDLQIRIVYRLSNYIKWLRPRQMKATSCKTWFATMLANHNSLSARITSFLLIMNIYETITAISCLVFDKWQYFHQHYAVPYKQIATKITCLYLTNWQRLNLPETTNC